jgi:hypothetical protein
MSASMYGLRLQNGMRDGRPAQKAATYSLDATPVAGGALSARHTA